MKNLTDFDMPLVGNAGYLHGEIKIFGVEHHVDVLRVSRDSAGDQVAWDDSVQPNLDALNDYYQSAEWATVKVPNFPGNWIVVIHPFDIG